MRSLILLLGLALVACEGKKNNSSLPPPPEPEPAPAAAPSSKLPVLDPAQLNFFQPLPDTAVKEALDDTAKQGQKLYFDPHLSAAGDVSCASCHDLEKAGVDGAKVSTGTKKTVGKRNTPTTINAAGSFAQGWDAASSTLEEFLPVHIADPTIMGGAKPPEKTTAALAAYIKSLFARSRFDKYLAGDKSALTEAEQTGIAVFVEVGCSSCHQGKQIGATQAQKLGVVHPWPAPGNTDPGRFAVTKKEADRDFFKVASLRNVSRTAPYLHDGSIPTLDQCVKLMAHHQLGKEIDDAQVNAIVAFLKTLDGDPAKSITTKPAK